MVDPSSKQRCSRFDHCSVFIIGSAQMLHTSVRAGSEINGSPSSSLAPLWNMNVPCSKKEPQVNQISSGDKFIHTCVQVCRAGFTGMFIVCTGLRRCVLLVCVRDCLGLYSCVYRICQVCVQSCGEVCAQVCLQVCIRVYRCV